MIQEAKYLLYGGIFFVALFCVVVVVSLIGDLISDAIDRYVSFKKVADVFMILLTCAAVILICRSAGQVIAMVK